VAPPPHDLRTEIDLVAAAGGQAACHPSFMPKGRADPLTIDQLADVARKALDNALTLLDEADGLLSFNRYPRAYALAILAGEEFGKFMMAQGAVGHLPGDEAFWSDFWKRFTSHDAKGVNFTSMVSRVIEDPEERRRFLEQIDRHVQADQDRKFAGLYVDVAADGSVVGPYDATDPDGASRLLFILGSVIRSYAQQFEDVDFHTFYRAAQAGATQMIEALKTNDPEVVAKAWDETLGRSDRGGSE
jgi:AbiV family abortive infection protein